ASAASGEMQSGLSIVFIVRFVNWVTARHGGARPLPLHGPYRKPRAPQLVVPQQPERKSPGPPKARACRNGVTLRVVLTLSSLRSSLLRGGPVRSRGMGETPAPVAGEPQEAEDLAIDGGAEEELGELILPALGDGELVDHLVGEREE